MHREQQSAEAPEQGTSKQEPGDQRDEDRIEIMNQQGKEMILPGFWIVGTGAQVECIVRYRRIWTFGDGFRFIAGSGPLPACDLV